MDYISKPTDVLETYDPVVVNKALKTASTTRGKYYLVWCGNSAKRFDAYMDARYAVGRDKQILHELGATETFRVITFLNGSKVEFRERRKGGTLYS